MNKTEFEETFNIKIDNATEKDIDAAYNSFMNLSNLLNITPQSLSLDGKVRIEINDIENENTMASDDSDENGSTIRTRKVDENSNLAHEWFHALTYYNTNETETMKYQIMTKGRNYCHDARVLDATREDFDHQYYCDDTELFARAFEGYVIDLMNNSNIKDECLVTWEDEIPFVDGESAYRRPQSEEREVIDEAIELYIDSLKNKGVLERTDNKNVHADIYKRYKGDNEDYFYRLVANVLDAKYADEKNVRAYMDDDMESVTFIIAGDRNILIPTEQLFVMTKDEFEREAGLKDICPYAEGRRTIVEISSDSLEILHKVERLDSFFDYNTANKILKEINDKKREENRSNQMLIRDFGRSERPEYIPCDVSVYLPNELGGYIKEELHFDLGIEEKNFELRKELGNTFGFPSPAYERLTFENLVDNVGNARRIMSEDELYENGRCPADEALVRDSAAQKPVTLIGDRNFENYAVDSLKRNGRYELADGTYFLRNANTYYYVKPESISYKFGSEKSLRSFIRTHSLVIDYEPAKGYDAYKAPIPEYVYVRKGFRENEVEKDKYGEYIKDEKGRYKVKNSDWRSERIRYASQAAPMTNERYEAINKTSYKDIKDEKIKCVVNKHFGIADPELSRISSALGEIQTEAQSQIRKIEQDLVEMGFGSSIPKEVIEDIDYDFSRRTDGKVKVRYKEDRDEQIKELYKAEDKVHQYEDLQGLHLMEKEKVKETFKESNNPSLRFFSDPVPVIDSLKERYPEMKKLTRTQTDYIAESRYIKDHCRSLLNKQEKTFVSGTISIAKQIGRVADKGCFAEVQTSDHKIGIVSPKRADEMIRNNEIKECTIYYGTKNGLMSRNISSPVGSLKESLLKVCTENDPVTNSVKDMAQYNKDSFFVFSEPPQKEKQTNSKGEFRLGTRGTNPHTRTETNDGLRTSFHCVR